MTRSGRSVVPLTAACGIALGTSACAPRAASVQGDGIRDLYTFFGYVAAAIFVVVVGLIGWSIVRYRAKPGDTGLPKQTKTNVRLEIVWFAIPQIIVVILFLVSAGVLGDVNETSPDPDVRVAVQGFQWGWRFDYEGSGVRVVSSSQRPATIVLPVGQTISFTLTSQDVAHSFYVPRFLMKRDTIPGKTNRVDITIDEAGAYVGKCAEFCGLLHEQMEFTLEAVSGDEFERWIADQQGAADGDG